MGVKLHLQKKRERLCRRLAEQGSGGTPGLMTVSFGACLCSRTALVLFPLDGKTELLFS